MELKSNKFTSVRYHNIFDFKLTKEELLKWQYKNVEEKVSGTKNKNRLQREKYSQAKVVIAKNASKLISKIPMVKFIGITGALAMNNANKDGDIDLMVITKNNTLWLTRLCVYCILHPTSYILRRPLVIDEKDSLCLNMWLDESDLIWDKADRNIYTAHEIAQIVPLINKDNVYEKFLYLNKWILLYWPNSVKIKDLGSKMYEAKKNPISYILHLTSRLLENVTYRLQYLYMKSKISREIVTPTRAIFHPNDWGKVIIKKLSS